MLAMKLLEVLVALAFGNAEHSQNQTQQPNHPDDDDSPVSRHVTGLPNDAEDRENRSDDTEVGEVLPDSNSLHCRV